MISYSVYVLCCFMFLFICKSEYCSILFTQIFIFLMLASITYSATLLYFSDILLLLNIYLIFDVILITYLSTKIPITITNILLLILSIIMYLCNFFTVWSDSFLSFSIPSDLYLYEILLLLNFSFIQDTKISKYTFYFINVVLTIPHIFTIVG